MAQTDAPGQGGSGVGTTRRPLSASNSGGLPADSSHSALAPSRRAVGAPTDASAGDGVSRTRPRSLAFTAPLVLLLACQFEAGLPAGAAIRCVDGACPTGYACRAQVGLCVPNASGPSTAPRIVSAEVSPSHARDGSTVTVRLVVDKPLLSPPAVMLTDARGVTRLTRTGGDALEHEYTSVVDQREHAEGLARLTADLVDVQGTEALAQPVGTTELDFTPPALLEAAFSAPRQGNDAGVLTVRPSEPVAVRVSLSEPLRPGAALRPTGTCDGGVAFEVRSERSGLLDFASRPVASADCELRLSVEGAVDLAGNVAPALALPLLLRVDGVPPVISTFTLRGVSDAGSVPARTFSRQPGFDRFVLQAEVDGTAVHTELQLDDAPLVGCTCAPTRCDCGGQVGAAAMEGTHVFKVRTEDLAGNPSTQSIEVRFDFTPPALVPSSVHLGVRAPVDCPLAATPALAAAGAVELDFSVDEAATAQVDAQPAAVTCTPTSNTATHFAFRGRALDGGSTPSVQLLARVTDAVGNSAALPLGAPFAIDVDAPAAADATTPGALAFERVPWGTADAGPSFTLVGRAGVAERGTTLQVLEGAVPIALAPVSDAGFSVPLGVDRRSLAVRVYDEACNASAPTRVRDVEWRASLAGKRRGRTFENPHTLERREPFAPTTTQAIWATEETLDQPLVQEAGLTFRPPSLTPRGRTDPGFVADPARGKLLVFGGVNIPSVNGYNDELLEWDLSTRSWTSRTPVPRPQAWPTARQGGVVVFDAHRQRLVVFSGQGPTVSDDLWEWEPVTGLWTNRTPFPRPTVWPSRRDFANAVFDDVRKRVVVYGGRLAGATTSTAELWEWDGADGSWTNRTPTPRPPSWPAPRDGAKATFDSARGRLVLFGGWTGGTTLDELWECDLATATWTNRTPTPRPTQWPRFAISLTFDSVRGRVILYGGSQVNDELWEWDGATGSWTGLTPTVRPPTWPSGNVQAITHDPAGQRVMALTDLQFSNAFIEYDQDAGVWTPIVATQSPSFAPGIRHHVFTFDSRRGKAVAFGGFDSVSRSRAVFEWDRGTGAWVNPAPSSLPPSWPTPRALAAGVFDPVADRTLVFGGSDNSGLRGDLLEWNGDAGTWTTRSPTAGWPTPRYKHAMAYDADRRVVVLFGGVAGSIFTALSSELWEWSSTTATWTNRTPTPRPSAWPAAREGHGLTYDAPRRKMVLFGGLTGPTPANDLWEWDITSATWTNRTPSPLPAQWPGPRETAGFTADPARGVVLLFGGGSGAPDELWEWNGQTGVWTERSKVPRPPGWPSGRLAPGLAFEPERKVLLLHGGMGTYGPLPELHVLGVDLERAPGIVARFTFAASGASPQVELQGATVEVRAGARAGQQPSAGAALLVSHGDVLSREHTGSSAAPEALSWTTTDPVRLRALFEGPERWVSVGVTPRGRSSPEQLAAVRLDWVELTVRYRVP